MKKRRDKDFILGFRFVAMYLIYSFIIAKCCILLFESLHVKKKLGLAKDPISEDKNDILIL